jgi:hypothetical protein
VSAVNAEANAVNAEGNDVNAEANAVNAEAKSVNAEKIDGNDAIANRRSGAPSRTGVSGCWMDIPLTK